MLTDYTYARGEVASQTRYTRLDANGQGIVVSDVTVSASTDASGRSVTVGNTPVVSDLGTGITLTVLNAHHQVVSSETIDTQNAANGGTLLANALDALVMPEEGGKVVVTGSDGWANNISGRAANALKALGLSHPLFTETAQERRASGTLLVAVSEVKDGQWSLVDQSVRAADEALTLSVTGTEHVHMTYDAFGNLLGTQTLSGNLATGEVRVLSQTRQVVDGLNRVTSVTDAAGNTVSTQYLDASRQVLVTQESGLVTERTFSVRGELLTESQQATGEETRTRGFVYDARGQLVATTYPNGSLSVQQYDAAGRLWVTVSATGQVTEYRRDSEGRVLQEIRYDSALDMTAWLDSQSNTLSVTADDILSQVSEKTTHRIIITEYDARGRLHRVIDGEGRVAETQYDHQDRQVGVLSYTEGDKANAVSATQTYDAAGRLDSQTDADGFITRHVYDEAGRLIETKTYHVANAAETSGLVDRVQTFYDAKGRQQYTVNAQGFVTETRYLDAGREVATYRYAKSVTHRDGGITSILNKAGDAQLLSRVRNDKAGRLVSSINQHGIETRYHYDDVTGLLRQQTAAANTDDSRSVYHTYTDFNELEGQVALAGKQEWQSLNLTDLVTQQGSQTTYNIMGWTESTTHPATGTTHYAYDNAGRLLSTTDAKGSTTSTTYNAFGETETRTAGGELKEAFTYDNAGRLARTVDGEGITTAYHYNHQGHVSHTVRQHVSDAYQAFNTTEGEARGDLIARYVTQYGYDARGNVIAQSVAKDTREGSSLTGGDTLTDIVPSAKLKYVSQWTRKYDHAGRVVEETDGVGRVTTQTYAEWGRKRITRLSGALQERIELDALGRTLKQADAKGLVTHYTYDDHLNAVVMLTPGGVRTVTESNAHGETTIVTDGEGNERHVHYDHRGQVTHTAFKAAGSDTLEVLTTNSYDTRTGQLAFTVDSEGAKTEYRYTANGLQWKVIQHVDDITLTTEYGYDSQHRRVWTNSEGRVTTVRYDSHNRQIHTELGGIATTYQYDANGQVLRSVDGKVIDSTETAPARVLEERVTEYGYDAQGSMTHKVVKSGADWDQTQSVRTTEYRYNDAGQVTEKITGNGAVTRYTYDGRGRVVHEVNALRYVTEYTYDNAGQVVKTTRYANAIDLPRKMTAFLMGQEIKKVADSTQDRVTRTQYDKDGRVTYEIDGAGYATGYTYNANGQVTQTTQYHQPTTEAGWSQTSAANRTTHSLYDGKGQLRFTVSPNGQVSERRYDGEGRVTQTLRYGETVHLTAALMDTEALSQHLKTQLANDVRSEMTVYDTLGRKRFTLDGDGYLVEYQYNRHSEVATKKAYVNNTAIKNAIITVRDGDSDIKDYAVFQQALDNLGGIEEASVELNAKLTALNTQQARIDSLNAELAQLEQDIASTDAANHALGVDINTAATRIDNLYLDVKEEAAYQENLKQDILELRAEIETKEDALRVQYHEELSAAQTAADTASAAYEVALTQKAITDAAVQALVTESIITELMPETHDDFASQSGAIARATESSVRAEAALAVIHDARNTLDARFASETDVSVKQALASALARLADVEAAVRRDGEASLTRAYTDASNTQAAATLLDVQMRLNNMEAQIAQNAFIALGSVVNVDVAPQAGQRDVEDTRTLDELNAALELAQAEYGIAQATATRRQADFSTYLNSGELSELSVRLALRSQVSLPVTSSYPALSALFDSGSVVHGYAEHYEDVYYSLLEEAGYPNQGLSEGVQTHIELMAVELEGSLQHSSLADMLSELDDYIARLDTLGQIRSEIPAHFWSQQSPEELWQSRHPTYIDPVTGEERYHQEPDYTLGEALGATNVKVQSDVDSYVALTEQGLELLAAYRENLSSVVEAKKALDAAQDAMFELQFQIEMKEQEAQTEALTLSLRQVSAELQALSTQIRDQQARIASDPSNNVLLDELAALVSDQNTLLTQQAELLVQLQTHNVHELLADAASVEAENGNASMMTTAQWEEAVAVARQTYEDAVETESEKNHRLSLRYFGEYAQPGILQDIEALSASYLPALNFDEAQQVLNAAQATLDVADPQELYSYRQESSAIKAEMDKVGNISSEAHSGVGLSGDTSRFIGAVFPYHQSQNYGYLHGYYSHYRAHLNERVSSVVDFDSFSGDVSRLNTLKRQVEWSDSDVVEAIALTEKVMTNYSLIYDELSTLADDFLTLEEAQSLRENNPGNTYQGLDAVDFPSMEGYSTQEILDEILAAVETNSQGSRSNVSREVSDVQSLQRSFQEIADARQRAKMLALFGGETANFDTFATRYARPSGAMYTRGDYPLIGALFPYWQHQHYGLHSGYVEYFETRVEAQLQASVDTEAFGNHASGLRALLSQSQWTDNDIAQGLALTAQWASDLESIDSVLSTLPEHFLTLEEAQALRESNPGNTYVSESDYLRPMDLPSSEEHSTQELLDTALSWAALDAEVKRNDIAQRLASVESMQAYFEALEQDRQRTRLRVLFGEGTRFDDFTARYEQVLASLSPEAAPTNVAAMNEAIASHIGRLSETASMSTENAELLRYREDNAAFIQRLNEMREAVTAVPAHFMTLEEAETLWQGRTKVADPATGAILSAEQGLTAARAQAASESARYVAKLDDALEELQSVQEALDKALLVEDAQTRLNSIEADAYLAKTQLSAAVAVDKLTTQRAGLDAAIEAEMAALNTAAQAQSTLFTDLQYFSSVAPTNGHTANNRLYNEISFLNEYENALYTYYTDGSRGVTEHYLNKLGQSVDGRAKSIQQDWDSLRGTMRSYSYGVVLSLRSSPITQSNISSYIKANQKLEQVLDAADIITETLDYVPGSLAPQIPYSPRSSFAYALVHKNPERIDFRTGEPSGLSIEDIRQGIIASGEAISAHLASSLESTIEGVATLGDRLRTLEYLLSERDRSDHALAGLQTRIEEEARALAQAELQATSNSTLQDLQALAASIEVVQSQLAEDTSNLTLQDELAALIHQQQALLAEQQSTLTALTDDGAQGLLVTNSLRNLEEATATRAQAEEDVEANKQQVADLKQEVAVLSEEIEAQLSAMADKRAEYEALEEEAERLRQQENELRDTLAGEESTQADALAVEAAKVGALTSLYTQKTILTSSQVEREAIEVNSQTIIRNASDLISTNEAVLTQHAQDITNKENELVAANKVLEKANKAFSNAKLELSRQLGGRNIIRFGSRGVVHRRGSVLESSGFSALNLRPEIGNNSFNYFYYYKRTDNFIFGPFEVRTFLPNEFEAQFQSMFMRKLPYVDSSSASSYVSFSRSISGVINEPNTVGAKIGGVNDYINLLSSVYRSANQLNRTIDGPYKVTKQGSYGFLWWSGIEGYDRRFIEKLDSLYNQSKNQIKTWASRAISGLKTIRTALVNYQNAINAVNTAKANIAGIEAWLDPYHTKQNEIATAEKQIADAQLALDTAQAAITDGEAALARVNVDIAEAEAALATSVASRKEAEASVSATRSLLAQAEIDKANAEGLVLAARQEINVAGGHYNAAQASLLEATTELGSAQSNLNVAMNLHLQAEQYIHDADMAKLSASGTLSDAEKVVQFSQYLLKRQMNAETASNDTSYEYDDRGQLIGEVSALVSYSERAEQGGLTQYIGRLRSEHQYDSLGNVVGTITAKGTADETSNTFVYDVDGNQTQSIGIAGSTVTFDATHQAIININADGQRRDNVYDAMGRLRFEVDELGYVTEHRYDGLNQKVAQRRYGAAFGGVRTPGEALTVETLDAFTASAGEYRLLRYGYDQRGQSVSTTQSSSVDTLSRDTQVALSAFGETLSVTVRASNDGVIESDVTTQAHLYSVAGQLLATRDAEHYVTLYGYNGHGEVVTQRELTARYDGDWTLDALNAWLADADTTAREQSFSYDNRGNRQQTTLHNVTYHRHNGALVEDVTNDLITTTYHDHAGRMYLTVTEEGTTDPDSHFTAADRTLLEYDALGRLVASWGKTREYLVDGLELGFKGALPERLIANQRTDYFYDAQGNQVATRVDGPIGRVTQQYFDDEGRLIGRRDAEGNYTAITTDAMNRVISERTEVNGNGYQHTRDVTYHYDVTGRQTGTTVSVNNADDIIDTVIYNAYGEVTAKQHNGTVQESYGYDGLGRVTQNTVKGVTTGYRYNWLDKVTAETVEGTRTTTRAYDQVGNLTQETGPAQDVNVATSLRSVTKMVHDRWGNVLTQTVNGHTHTLSYNHANQVTKQVGPSVDVVRADGSIDTSTRVMTLMYYDRHGNRIAVQDGNGHWQKSYYDLTGQKLMDVNGVGGTTHYYHNAFGDEIARVNAAGQGEVFTYDNNSQLLTRAKVSKSKGYLEVYATYAYDQAGQRYHEQWQGASGYEIFTRYDAAGRVLETQGAGQHKRYTYDSFGNRKTESWLASGAIKATKTSHYDTHGRLKTQTLYSGDSVSYGYDEFGQLKTKSGAITQNYDYWDNGLLKTQTAGSKKESYAYNASGQETTRTLTDNGHKLVTRTEWDALGRIQGVTASEIQQTEAIDEYERVWTIHYDEDGDSYRTWEDVKKPDVVHTLADSSVQYFYDAVGNRRKVVTSGEQSGTRWYHYDDDNRTVGSHTRSTDVALNSIQGQAGDRRITYNALGQKITELSWETEQREVEYTAFGFSRWSGQYEFTAKKTLSETVKNETHLSYDKNGHIAGINEYEYVNGTRYNTRAMTQTNSMTGHAERSTDVTRTYTYSRDNIETSPTTAELKSSKTSTTDILYSADGRAYSQVVNTTGEQEVSVWMDYHFSGQLAVQRTFHTIDGQSVVDTQTYAYQGRENFQKESITANTTRRVYSKNFTPGTTTFHYNNVGHLTKVTSTKEESERQILTDFNGQIALQVADGKLSAELTNGGNPLANIAIDSVNADLLSDSGASAGQQPGTYTVAANDTLQRISQLVYGDSRYWYLIADANGLSPTEPLIEGKVLVIPNQHTQTFNGAESFKPYNESEVLGNVNPDPIAPPPPKKSCNPIAQIVMVVIAVVVAYYTGVYIGNLAGSAVVGGAVGGAAGSAASQLVGIALGEVESFSWKQVATGALAGAVTAGLNTAGVTGFSKAAISYGVNYAGSKVLGQDVSFSWEGLVASTVGSLVGSSLGGESGYLSDWGLTNTLANDYISGFVGSATTSVLRGDSFRDNAGALAVDAFGNVLGNAVVGEIERQNASNTAAAKVIDKPRERTRIGGTASTNGVGVYFGGAINDSFSFEEEAKRYGVEILLDDSDEPQAFVNTEVLEQQAGEIFDSEVYSLKGYENYHEAGLPIESTWAPSNGIVLSSGAIAYGEDGSYQSNEGWVNEGRRYFRDNYPVLGLMVDIGLAPLDAIGGVVGLTGINSQDGVKFNAFTGYSMGINDLQTAAMDILTFGVATLESRTAKATIGLVDDVIGNNNFVDKFLVEVDPNKFNYLFGRARKDEHNTPRTKQLYLYMERLGVHDNAKGRQLLEDHFRSVAQQEGNIVTTWTDKFGTFEIRESIFFGPSGKAVKFETGFMVHENGTRRFTSAIPKADWRKFGKGGVDNLRSDGEPPEWWPHKVVNDKK
ncbi:hypothetical protein [Enterovibrio baiacu]|uniref:hypothetical protein n=1 Tax=Enterovibrio baiacu TaxID=2491023 RepID=UPI00196AC7C3|nr:hypothetical protein [Enterovibrio baiacu]